MQQLVIAVLEMMTARTLPRETSLSRTTRWCVGGIGPVGFWSAWRMRDGSWESAVATLPRR